MTVRCKRNQLPVGMASYFRFDRELILVELAFG